MKTVRLRGRGFALLGGVLCVSGAVSGCGGGGAAQSGGVSIQDVGGDSGARAAACGNAPYLPNYAAETDSQSHKPNALYRWITMPVTVYFENGPEVTPERVRQVLNGFDWWVQSSSDLVAYRQTTDPKAANITVRFAYQGNTGYGALTTYTISNGRYLTHADITFNVAALPVDALYAPAAAHELGHAVGIGGHSNTTTDIMAFSPEIYNLAHLSARDLNTLKTAYCSGAASGGKAAQAGSLHTESIP